MLLAQRIQATLALASKGSVKQKPLGNGGQMTLAEWMLFGAVLLFLLTLAPVKASKRLLKAVWHGQREQ